MPIALYVQVPFANRHENHQLEELLSMLDDASGRRPLRTCRSREFPSGEGKVGGQFDVVAIRDHMIMILELKDMVATVIGDDSHEPWTSCTAAAVLCNGNYSTKCCDNTTPSLPIDAGFRSARAGHEEDHFYVDARLVFREGSEFKVSLSSPQVQRWFRVITFGEVLHEVATGGKAEFTISPLTSSGSRMTWSQQSRTAHLLMPLHQWKKPSHTPWPS